MFPSPPYDCPSRISRFSESAISVAKAGYPGNESQISGFADPDSRVREARWHASAPQLSNFKKLQKVIDFLQVSIEIELGKN